MRALLSLTLFLLAGTLAAQEKPTGEHYNLNLLGKSKLMPTDSLEADSGNVIFVSLVAESGLVSTRILLSQTPDSTFRVLDKNGTDGEARFALPAVGAWDVYARPIGKPGGSVGLSTCGSVTDTLGATAEECNLGTVVVRASKGKGKGKAPKRAAWSNVTSILTSFELDPVADSAMVAACGGASVALFNPCFSDYFWNASAADKGKLQLRFYPVTVAP